MVTDLISMAGGVPQTMPSSAVPPSGPHGFAAAMQAASGPLQNQKIAARAQTFPQGFSGPGKSARSNTPITSVSSPASLLTFAANQPALTQATQPAPTPSVAPDKYEPLDQDSRASVKFVPPVNSEARAMVPGPPMPLSNGSIPVQTVPTNRARMERKSVGSPAVGAALPNNMAMTTDLEAASAIETLHELAATPPSQSTLQAVLNSMGDEKGTDAVQTEDSRLPIVSGTDDELPPLAAPLPATDPTNRTGQALVQAEASQASSAKNISPAAFAEIASSSSKSNLRLEHATRAASSNVPSPIVNQNSTAADSSTGSAKNAPPIRTAAVLTSVSPETQKVTSSPPTIDAVPTREVLNDAPANSHSVSPNQGQPAIDTSGPRSNSPDPPPVTLNQPVGAPAPSADSALVSGTANAIASIPLPSQLSPQTSSVNSSAQSTPSISVAHSLPAPDASTSNVQVARIVDSVGRSEMHIDLRTQDFGSVDVHTILRENQLGLTVGSEKGDLRSFLAPEVSALQTFIHQQDLRLDAVRFIDHSSQMNSGLANNRDPQSQSQSQSSRHAPTAMTRTDSRELLPLEEALSGSTTGLNVHA